MKDMWTSLEEHTRAWRALDREGLADAVWSPYVTARFSRTGDPRALAFLHPYLNRGDRGVRLHAIDVASRVFHGAGPKAIAELDYITNNTNPFLRDRAVRVVGATLAGWPVKTILEHLAPHLTCSNQFTRRLAAIALSRAAMGTADGTVLARIKELAAQCRLTDYELTLAVARIFAGKPTEEAYSMIVSPQTEDGGREADTAVGILLRGASDKWYQRGCREYFEPRLHQKKTAANPWVQFTHRGAIVGLCRVAGGRGMEALGRMLHLRHNACTVHTLVSIGPGLFAGADGKANRTPLLDMARTGDVPTQRIGAVCLGGLLAGSEDEEAVALLKELCGARNRAVASSAITGLGMVARSSCDQELRTLCLDMTRTEETATAAIIALGMLFQGSARSDIFKDIREIAGTVRHQRRPSRKHSRPLVQCLRSVGMVYQGTGSMEPVDFLLDAMNLSRKPWCEYRHVAGKALVMIEFPAGTIARTLEQPWI